MSDDELFDDELRGALSGLAPRTDDTDEMLAAMRPRARRARTRRRAKLAAATGVLSLVLVAGAAALVNDGNDRVQTVPADPGDGTSIPFETSTTTVASVSTTTDTTPTTAAAVPSTMPETADDSVPGSSLTTPTSPSPSTGGTTAPTTYDSRGGSITVRLASGNVELLSVTPAAGFAETRREVEADRIRVEFESDAGDQSRIEVEEKNGVLQPKIED